MPRATRARMRGHGTDWWRSTFGKKYLRSYRDILSTHDVEREINWISHNLLLSLDANILDLACGHGRHLMAFGRKGFSNLFGLDQSRSFLREAKNAADREGVFLTLIHGDMRSVPFREKFDLVLSMFTSFGYFDNYEQDLIVLKEIYASLKNGGKVLLDLNNPFTLINHAHSIGPCRYHAGCLNVSNTEILSDGLRIEKTYRINPATMRWEVIRRWRERGRSYSYTARIVLYTAPLISLFLRQAGFEISNLLGDFDGSDYKFDSPRLIVLGEKSQQYPNRVV